MNSPITCSWPQSPTQTVFGASIDLTNPANWQCATSAQTSKGIQTAAGIAAVGALFVLPGFWKLAALPLGLVWLSAGIGAGGGL